MVVKIYISRTSADKEIKSRQQTIVQILEAKKIHYELVDIAEKNKEEEKEFMQKNAIAYGGTITEAEPVQPLPPQIFNEKEYCGDFEKFEIANENNELHRFLKLLPADELYTSSVELKINE